MTPTDLFAALGLPPDLEAQMRPCRTCGDPPSISVEVDVYPQPLVHFAIVCWECGWNTERGMEWADALADWNDQNAQGHRRPHEPASVDLH